MNVVIYPRNVAFIFVAILILLIFRNIQSADAFVMFDELPPTITSVIPKSSYNLNPSLVTIIGNDFLETPTVKLGALRLTHVTFIDNTTVTATIPSDLPIGTYSISLINPGGESSYMENAFTILSGSDGVLRNWVEVNPLPFPRTEYAMATTDEFVYLLGGYDNVGTNLSSVQRAKINLDGILSVWEESTPLPEPVYRFSSVIVDEYVFIAGGQGLRPQDIVESAKVNPDGSFGIWKQMDPLNNPRSGHAMVAVDNCIYVLGGEYSAFSMNDVEMAKVGEDGSLSSWQYVAPLNKPRAFFEALHSVGYIYALGGAGLNEPVERAEIRPDCTLDSWEIVSFLGEPVYDPASVVSRGYIYILGGRRYSDDYNQVQYAQIYSDGSLGLWESANSLGTERSEFSAAKVREFIYAIGGRGEWGEILGSIEQSRVNSSIPIYLPFFVMNE